MKPESTLPRHIALTAEIRTRLQAVYDALAAHRPGADPLSSLDLPKLELADAVIDQVRAARLPRRARAVKATLRSTRRMRRGA